MYEPPKTTESLPPPPVRARAGRGAAFLVFVLLITIGLALGWMHQQQQRRLGELSADLAATRAEAAETTRREAGEIAALRAQLESQASALNTLSSAQLGDRSRLQMALVEHLLLSANERLQLSRDAAGARLALELADARLALLGEPRLHKLRETIARERGALSKLPHVDSTSALLSLSAMIEAAPALPLAARVPERFEAAPEAAPAPPPEADSRNWLERGWAQARQALNAMFSVRRARGPAPRLLGPEQEVQVYQILLLRLESVRAALVRGQQPILREAAASAAHWLRQRFHVQDAGVQSALAELQRIGELPLDASLPDISGSLTQLRELGAGP